MAISLGVGAATLARMMRALGFVVVGKAEANRWKWRGRPIAARDVRPDNPAFAALKSLSRKGQR